MASGPITYWQIDGEKVETGTDFIFLGSRTTADGDWSHKIKTLAPWKQSYDKSRQHIKKQRHYFATKGPSNQSYGFSSGHVHYECWIIKKAECWRTDAFKLWCWRRLLRVPWRARRSNQSILKETNTEYSLEGLMLELKFQYFGYLMQIANSLEKSHAGKNWGQEKKGWQRMKWLSGIWTQWRRVWANSGR